MADAQHRSPLRRLTQGGSEMGRLMRERDWSASPLGPTESWPQPLRTLVDLMLASSQPMFVAWGPERTLLYNDAYAGIAFDKHPAALGRDFLQVWSEISDDLAPIVARAYAGEAVHMEDITLVMERRGYPEQTHFSFSYTPVRNEDGRVAGFFGQCIETTARVLAERRRAFRVALDERLRGLAEPRAIMAAAAEALGRALGADRAGYAELDASGETFIIREDWVAGDMPSLAGRHRLDDFGPALIARLRTGSIVSFDDARTELLTVGDVAARTLGQAHIIAAISVPLIKEGRLAAALYAHFRAPHRCTDEERAVAADVAERTWAAVERARAEAALRESEARFRGVFDARLTGLTIFDAMSGDTLAINDTFLGMTGHTRADFEDGRWDWRDFTLAEYLHLDEAAIAQARERGWWETYEKEYRRRDGTRFPVRIASAPLPGEPGRVVVSVQDVSEARAAEAGLRESEARFRNMADSAPVMMWVTDPTGACTHLNARWYEFTGQAPGAGEGYGWLDAVHPDDRPAAEAAFVSANAERRNYRVDFRLRRADGTYRWVIDAAAARFAGTGEYLGYVGSVIDIDERREMEDALRGSEERLRLATEAAAIGTFDFEPLTGALAWDDRCKELFGLPPDADVDYDMFLAGLHPDDRAMAHEAVQKALAPEGPRDFAVEYRAVGLRDGVERWIAAHGRAFFEGTDRARRARRFVGTVIDITAMKRAEEELEQRVAHALAERRLLADIVEGTDAFVQVLDPSFRWLAINRAAADEFERIYGVRPSVGQSTLDILDAQPEHREAVRAVWGRALAGEEFTEVGEFGDPGRDRRCYEMKYNVLRDARGEQVGAYQFVYDVTQRIAEQRRLAEAEEALRQSQKMEAMGSLTGGVAHDFNNLLTPIVGVLDVLQRRGVGGEREQRLIGAAAQSAERARVLVQRLLAFARRQPLQPVAVDVGALVTGMADLVSSTTGPQIKVVLDVGRDLPPAKADPNQLEMAVLNLAVNARDAMPDGGTLRLSVEAATVGPQHRSKLKPGRYLHLSVSDTGTGMDEVTLARAVEPFFSTKGVGRGTGLGLSMVHGLASQLGGALTIRSTVGMGTNIELWLPEGGEPAEPVEPAMKEQAAVPGRGTVLLVDDEELVRLSTADMLIELGYAVVEAGSAEEALRLLNRGLKPDAVVTDHLMPGMSGTEFARRLRAERPGIGVLVVSGYAETEGIAPDLPRLAKPFRRGDLAASLSALG